MKIFVYFPFYMILLLWLLVRISREEKPESISAFELSETYGWLHKLELEIDKEKMKPEFLRRFLVKKIQEEQILCMKLAEVGFTESGFIKKG